MANHSRGLCSRCYYQPAIKTLYPPARGQQRGIGCFPGPGRPCQPTEALPGTEAKVLVMMGRAERGEMLFHELDARIA